MDVLVAILPLIGVALGAFLQHKFASTNQRAEQIDLRRHEAYADYLRGVAALAGNRSKEPSNVSLVADAKSRIAIYGSAEVLDKLGKFEEVGPNLADQEAIEAFLSAALQMRQESFPSDINPNIYSIRLLLFGSICRD
jgi:hypothetical protein